MEDIADTHYNHREDCDYHGIKCPYCDREIWIKARRKRVIVIPANQVVIGEVRKDIEKEDMDRLITKACEWLRANIDLYADTRRSLFSNYQEVYLTDNFETEFRKAMEE